MIRLHVSADESGQTLVEFGFIAIALFMLTIGLLDSGRAFFQYNAIAAAVRYGARWGSVVGGTCADYRTLSATSSWCTNLSSSSSTVDFWNTLGNKPNQASGSTCSTSYPPSNYYKASDYTSTTSTTIVGSIMSHFDTDSTTTNKIGGSFAAGFDRSKLDICVELESNSWSSTNSDWEPHEGDVVKVYAYYPFNPAGPLLGGSQIPLVASSQYVIE